MIGILALQGCVEPHARHLAELGIPCKKVRLAADLDGVRGLILPGGESTTMLHLMRVFQMVEPLQATARVIPFWGVCAGAILMAKELMGARGPGQVSLGIMDVTVERNAYGRQLESFTDDVELTGGVRESATFIRAPKFIAWGACVEVCGRYRNEVVFLSEGRHMMTAFHPELSENLYFHRLFAERAGFVNASATSQNTSARSRVSI